MDFSNYFWQGDKVRLRPFRLDDAEQSYLDSLDTPTRQSIQLGTELPTSVELEKESLRKYLGCKDADGVILFAIENLDGTHVGAISYHTRHPKNGTFSFGITVRAGNRKMGYAEDALRILLRYAFHQRRYQKCNSACLHTNTASIRLHQKVGFFEEGRRRRQLFMNGEYHDELLFGMTREEFDENEEGWG
jgi:RimJ/RimL family protein N-acetyltransferase